MAIFEDSLASLPFGGRNLRLTDPPMTGTDVKVLQFLLTVFRANAVSPSISNYALISGVYDAATAGLVREYQEFYGLTADGVAGPQTFFAFGQGTGPDTTYGGPVFGSRFLAVGSEGGDVVILQNRLNVYAFSQELGGPADGVYGPHTSRAVFQFQGVAANSRGTQDTGLLPDGLVKGDTFDALWIYTYAGGRALFEGRNGLDTLWLQHVLALQGFYPGSFGGYFGSELRGAVETFQRVQGITVDGVAGPETFYAIGSAYGQNPPWPMFIPPGLIPPANQSPGPAS